MQYIARFAGRFLFRRSNMWGHSHRSSPFPLNYERISRELEERKTKKGIRNRDHVVVNRPNVIAHRVAADAVALKLHSTDIVTWFANGDRLFDGGGWSQSQTTRHWWWQAERFRVWNKRINKWSEQYTLCRIDGYVYPFNGMLRIDGAGHKLDEAKAEPIMKRLPNAEAKAYRKHIRAMLRTHYQPHCNMLSTMDWQEKYQNGQVPNRTMYNLITAVEKGEVDLDLLDAVLWTYRWGSYKEHHPFVLFMSWAMRQVDAHVKQHRMFDEVPYQPKEN